ncbi:MAG: aspartate-semialdehyde dehydrogenase [Proteobacteria bacterium]|nr:aspartate-semialdehyde dehydrogenase [Pseudomonadota bacterium]
MAIISVIGATGNVGRIVIAELLARKMVKMDKVRVLASKRSAGQMVDIAGHQFTVYEATRENIQGSDICIFNTESDVSEQLVPLCLRDGAYVIDSSSHYRLATDVPLIVPPVNAHLINQQQKLYAHANCLVSPVATVAAPLHKIFEIKNISVTTYQSTSGAGKGPMDECWDETIALTQGNEHKRRYFARQIAFNVIPQVGNIREDGLTSEEYKIIHESKKVIGQEINISATAVRVPVLRGHCIALEVSFAGPVSVAEVEAVLASARSVQLSKQHQYHTPAEVVGHDDVFVGRIRVNPFDEKTIQIWLCSDNLRRGAATDAVEIAGGILQVAKLH